MGRKRIAGMAAAAAAVALAAAASVGGAGAVNGHADYRAVCPGPPFEAARCNVQVVTDAQGNPLATTGPSGYGPSQLHSAYGLPTSAPSAQTIAIVDAYDDPNAETDLGVYSNQYGLPSCTSANGCFKKVNQSGSTKSLPGANSSWALEISLDVQVAHAMCQNCKILLVEASSAGFSNLMAAVDTAVKMGATVISNSYGATEFSGETTYDSHFNVAGRAFVASSGDSGYGVQWPAASPYVTAVGGTTLTLTSTGARSSETAWSKGGSGCSAYEAKPSWQHDAGCAKRTVADVAADGDPSTGAAVYDSYGYSGSKGWFVVGGTSLAAPIVGAAYALAGNASSVTAAGYLYGHATAGSTLYDVLQGSNGTCTTAYLCTAGTGFDGPTGLGAPIGTGAF